MNDLISRKNYIQQLGKSPIANLVRKNVKFSQISYEKV